jgi:hypothetical protein
VYLSRGDADGEIGAVLFVSGNSLILVPGERANDGLRAGDSTSTNVTVPVSTALWVDPTQSVAFFGAGNTLYAFALGEGSDFSWSTTARLAAAVSGLTGVEGSSAGSSVLYFSTTTGDVGRIGFTYNAASSRFSTPSYATSTLTDLDVGLPTSIVGNPVVLGASEGEALAVLVAGARVLGTDDDLIVQAWRPDLTDLQDVSTWFGSEPIQFEFVPASESLPAGTELLPPVVFDSDDYVVVTSTDGKLHAFYLGDLIPAGSDTSSSRNLDAEGAL